MIINPRWTIYGISAFLLIIFIASETPSIFWLIILLLIYGSPVIDIYFHNKQFSEEENE